MYCPANCPCRTQRDSELQELKDQKQHMVHTLNIKNLFKTRMWSQGASLVGKETQPSDEAMEIFSIAPWVPSKNTDARISRCKLKKRVKISRSQRGRRRPGKEHRMPSKLPPALPLQLLIPTP